MVISHSAVRSGSGASRPKPPEQIPDLVDENGRFPVAPVRDGIRLFFLPRVQRQVAAEMRAQFERFRATGLPLGHVDGHHHFHRHPTVVGLLVSLASAYGVRAVRLPQEPWWPSWRAQRDRPGSRLLAWLLSVPRATRMRQRLRRVGICCNDHLFGLHESGAMTPERVRCFLRFLPPGVSELYCHPATRHWEGSDALPADYRCVEEFRAVADPTLLRQLEQEGIELARYPDLEPT